MHGVVRMRVPTAMGFFLVMTYDALTLLSPGATSLSWAIYSFMDCNPLRRFTALLTEASAERFDN